MYDIIRRCVATKDTKNTKAFKKDRKPCRDVKIVFYTREGAGQAGAEFRSYALCRELRQKGLEAEVLSFQDFHFVRPRFPGWLNKTAVNVKVFLKLMKLRPGVLVLQRINHHFPAAFLYFLVKRPRLILDVDDWESREDMHIGFSGMSNSISDMVLKIVCRFAECTVVSSRFLFEYLTPYSKRITLIPSGIDDTRFYFERKPLPLMRFVWCGSLDRKDTLEEILHLTSRFHQAALKTLELLLIARGLFVSDLSRHLRSLGNSSIKLMSHVLYSRIPILLQTCQAGLLPLFSPTCFNRAKSPVKLFEYMASGLIPVTTYIGEAAEIITASSGFAVSDSKEMIQTMNDISSMNIEVIESMIRKNREMVRSRFSLLQVGQSWETLLKNGGNSLDQVILTGVST
ncbi:MAG: glycosyltransferase [Candidatus Aureabacteria bacterium]|nr:glycosyltransferase [Candidatus Auribacterota bacterium]